MTVFLIIGVTALIVSMLSLGGVPTDRQSHRERSSYQSETSEHRNFRTKLALYTGLIAVFSLAIAGFTYLLR
ncbi:hypothetical protein [Paraliobacillus sediminis]|uniref:hypothetical protein n=1 Tax=Paraliobacillus sediminis TaxID=1885916 RepID=UPI000E3DBD99|nr:hypothetical protein [Paraliobacillus sediminis]